MNRFIIILIGFIILIVGIFAALKILTSIIPRGVSNVARQGIDRYDNTIRACGQESNPVCGTDGLTYINACYATVVNKVAVLHSGACHGTAVGGGTVHYTNSPQYSGVPTYPSYTNVNPNNPQTCQARGGVWINGYNVCEINYLSSNQCIQQGGHFNACASACRYQNNAQFCTMQCVQTCTFR